MPECARVEQATISEQIIKGEKLRQNHREGNEDRKGVMPLQAEECHRLPAAFQGRGQTEMDVAVLEEGTLTTGM